ncbi:hypothetical protein G7046_g3924 [Stylonectria norvegica]|nr:hypothetical protein G7046_g3924 [Stylonectria norvegica]
MEQFLIENTERYTGLVKRFNPPTSPQTVSEGSSSSPSMVVATRLRPLVGEELTVGIPVAIYPRVTQPGFLDVHELRQPPRGLPLLRSFQYQTDRIYDAESTTDQLYGDIVKPLVPWAWNGGIGTLFAYGQTGSGKTFTVSGLEALVAEELMSGALEGTRKIFITIIELAGNAAHDLLNTRRPVSVLEDSFGNTQLAGALEHEITTVDEMLRDIETATSFRHTEATWRNDTSSRSHAICRIRIQNPTTPAAEDGVLYLVDLAGSEAARDSANHGPQRTRELREINLSLSVLKDCIRGKAEADTLAAGSTKRKPHVPFRQSALTKVLKHVFDPIAMRAWPSKNTLRYAETLRFIVPKTKPVRYDPKVPMTWSNEQLREWISKNSGNPQIDAAVLAPTESGMQLLRLPPPEFEMRCRKTDGVTLEQAKAFRSKFWQMHVDSQRPRTTVGTTGAEPVDELDRSSSRDPNPKAFSIPFEERIRPGMTVSWTPPRGHPMALPGLNLVTILCPAAAVGEDVCDAFGKKVKTSGAGDEKDGRYLCAVVTPALMAEAYDVQLWRQIVLGVEVMEGEVILEYDVATRYYYIAI